ncbi:MAG: hypothetical protein PHQ75_00330, partial [Thermoguttaceae bacterium]|nr:hypothetical protein [Thermoguttaceae bacterium]
MKKTLTIVTMFFSVTILMSGFSSIANEQKDELCSDCVPVVKQEKQRALGRFLRKFRNRLDESNCVTCENNAESAQNVPAPVAPAPAVKPAPVAPAPAVKPAPVAPAPAVKPAPVAPAPAAKPAPVAPAPAVKP